MKIEKKVIEINDKDWDLFMKWAFDSFKILSIKIDNEVKAKRLTLTEKQFADKVIINYLNDMCCCSVELADAIINNDIKQKQIIDWSFTGGMLAASKIAVDCRKHLESYLVVYAGLLAIKIKLFERIYDYLLKQNKILQSKSVWNSKKEKKYKS